MSHCLHSTPFHSNMLTKLSLSLCRSSPTISQPPFITHLPTITVTLPPHTLPQLSLILPLSHLPPIPVEGVREHPIAIAGLRLQAFAGHKGNISKLLPIESENIFISASRDKTVKLWSLSNHGNGEGISHPQLTYSLHQRAIVGLEYLPARGQVASCGTKLHVSFYVAAFMMLFLCAAIFISNTDAMVTLSSILLSPTLLFWFLDRSGIWRQPTVCGNTPQRPPSLTLP